MPVFEFKSPDGKTYEVTGPEGSTPQEAFGHLQTQISGGQAQPQSDPDAYHGPGDTRRGTYGFTDQMLEQGVMLGFGDEAEAGIQTGFDTLSRLVHGKAPEISSDYDKEVAFRRAQRNEWELAHPVAKYVAPIIGGAGAAGPARAAIGAVAPTLGRQVIQGAKVGAGVGAAAGFGSGEGGFENRALNAAGGAVTGGVIGAAAPAAVEGVRGAYGAVKALLGINSPEEVASNQITTALARSGRTPDEVSTAISQAQDLGVPAVPADTALSLRRLGRAVETVPGQASEKVTELLNERQAGQAARVSGQLNKSLGSDGNALGMADDIMAARKAAAAPLYERAYAAQNADMTQEALWSPELESLLKTPAARQAYARAKVIAANEREPSDTLSIIGFKIKPGDFGSYGEFKNPIMDRTPNMKSWDYIKRGLDDVLEKYRNPVTGRLQLDEAGRAVLGVKNDLLSELDRINPAYAKARQVFAGHSDMLDALHAGQDFLSGDFDQVTRNFNQLTDSEQDMYRVGGMNALRTKINQAKDGSDIYGLIFGSPEKRARIGMLMKDQQEFQTFARIMQLERETTKTQRLVTGGSPTGRIAAEQSDLAVGAVEDAFHGRGPMVMAMNAARRMLTRAKGINEDTATRIATYLFNPNPNAATQAIDPTAIQAMIAAAQKRAGITGLASRGATVGVTARK